jgi:hypothetical protein
MSDFPPPTEHSQSSASPNIAGNQPSWWKRRWLRLPVWAWIAIGLVVVLIAAAAAGGGDANENLSTEGGTANTTLPESTSSMTDPTTEAATTVPATDAVTSLPETSTTAEPEPTTVPPTPATTSPPTVPGFNDGLLLVGTDIQPGRYIATDLDLCYWARLKDASGSLDAIIANDNAVGQAIVDIAPTDALFDSTRCGRWSVYLPPAAPLSAFGEGAFVVNHQIAPGRYRSAGGDLCYWQRTTGFGGTLDEIIANDNVSGPAIVDIAASDTGFTSRGCGDWALVG